MKGASGALAGPGELAESDLLGTSVSHMPGDGADARGWGAAPPLGCGSQVLGSPARLGQTSSGDSSQAPVGMAVKQLRASLQPSSRPADSPPLCPTGRARG